MKMKDVMNLFHISEGTIRYYEKMGIIRPGRNENNYRVFDFESLVNLMICQKYNGFGLSYKESIHSLRDRTLTDNISIFERKLEDNKKELRKLTAINMYYQNLCLELKKFECESSSFVERTNSILFYEVNKGDFHNPTESFEDEKIAKWIDINDVLNFEVWCRATANKEMEWKRVLTVDTELIKLYSDYVPENNNCLTEKKNLVSYVAVPFHGTNELSNEVSKLLDYSCTVRYRFTGFIRARILMIISGQAYLKIMAEIQDDEKTKVVE